MSHAEERYLLFVIEVPRFSVPETAKITCFPFPLHPLCSQYAFSEKRFNNFFWTSILFCLCFWHLPVSEWPQTSTAVCVVGVLWTILYTIWPTQNFKSDFSVRTCLFLCSAVVNSQSGKAHACSDYTCSQEHICSRIHILHYAHPSGAISSCVK